jgi:hypothetical protein
MSAPFGFTVIPTGCLEATYYEQHEAHFGLFNNYHRYGGSGSFMAWVGKFLLVSDLPHPTSSSVDQILRFYCTYHDQPSREYIFCVPINSTHIEQQYSMFGMGIPWGGSKYYRAFHVFA